LAEANAGGAARKEYLWLDDVPVGLIDDTGASPVLYFIHTDQLGAPQKITNASAAVVSDSAIDPFDNQAAVPSGGSWGTSVWGGFSWGASSHVWGTAKWGSFSWGDLTGVLWGSTAVWEDFSWSSVPVSGVWGTSVWRGFVWGAAPDLSLTNLRFPGQYADAETALNQNWFRDYDPTIGRYIQSDPIGLAGGPNTYAYVGSNPVYWIDPSGLALEQNGYQSNSGCGDAGQQLAGNFLQILRACMFYIHCLIVNEEPPQIEPPPPPPPIVRPIGPPPGPKPPGS